MDLWNNLYPTEATYVVHFLWRELASCWQQLLAKTYDLRYQNGAMVSDSFGYRKTKAVDNMASVLWGRHFKSSV